MVISAESLNDFLILTLGSEEGKPLRGNREILGRSLIKVKSWEK